MNKYQVRIRKDETDSDQHKEALALLGGGKVTRLQTLTGQFENIAQAFEKMAGVPELAEWEVISVILVDEDNREQLGEDFEWEDENEE